MDRHSKIRNVNIALKFIKESDKRNGMNISSAIYRTIGKKITDLKILLRNLEGEQRELEQNMTEYQGERPVRLMGMFRTPDYPSDYGKSAMIDDKAAEEKYIENRAKMAQIEDQIRNFQNLVRYTSPETSK